jgi:hypothetical protein
MIDIFPTYSRTTQKFDVWTELRKTTLDTDECMAICAEANKLGVKEIPRVHFSHECLRTTLGVSVGIIERILDAVDSKGASESLRAIEDAKKFIGGFIV